jgi:sugar phosphate isomerase/epimerase
MMQDRRSFIVTLGGAALALAGGARQAVAALVGHRRISRIGMQLYTVRRQAMTDLPGTLIQLAKIGYKEIEFWGSFSIGPAEIRRILDQNGLTSPSVHVGFPTTPDTYAKIFADAKVMGHEWITVPVPPNGPVATVDDWKRIAKQFNDAGSRIKAAGFRFAYHNHTGEFKKIGDVVPMDILLQETDPALVSYELDLHWAIAGGADPIDLFHRYPKRFKMVHVKDGGGPPDYKQTDVGAGTHPWAKILDIAQRDGVEHYFVENDEPADPMAFAKHSFDYLAKLEF